jgi:hypothetical protein
MASLPERVLEALKEVGGQPCWSAMASHRTDYVVVLDCGAKHRRSMRLANPRLSFLQRTYEGEFSFLIECTWRIDGPRGVVASCFDSNEPGGLMLKALAEIEGRTIEEARFENAGCDLTIRFEGGFELRCLSTETDPRRRRNNWSYWSPRGLVTVGPRGMLKLETAAEADRRFQKLKHSLAQEEEGLVSSIRGRRDSSDRPLDEAPDAESTEADDD